MDHYHVNKEPQPKGEHEVHTTGCKFFPKNTEDLYMCSDCHEALDVARKFYSNVDGCKHCCEECHTK